MFLYFFEAKSLGKKLWVSFNGVAGRVLLALFQQSYKGFKGKFFGATRETLPSWTGFPFTEQRNLSSRSPDASRTYLQREVCNFFSDFQEVFSTVELLKLEFNPTSLKGYIGTPFFPLLLLVLFLLVCCLFGLLCVFIFLCRHGA